MTDVFKCDRCWGLGKDGFATCLLCNGRGVLEDSPLSAHFRASEWRKAHEGCPNDPPPDAADRARMTARLLEPARVAMGIPFHVTSGYRCAQLDVIADHGNAKWLTHISGHQLGSAFDLRPGDPSVSLKQLLDGIVKHSLLPWDQIIGEGGCVHVAAEGPDSTGMHARPPGCGSQRKQVLVRVKWNEGFTYARYDGTDEQWAQVA
jgi:hypothetical protein